MRPVRIVTPVAVALAITGCGGDKVAENVIERQIEAESGEDVDIDLGDGDISIKTEDGELSIQTDEDGNFSIQSEDGETSFQSDGDQTIIQSDDGTTIIGATDGELPDGFPEDLPLPNGMLIEYTQSIAGDDGQNYLVGGSIDGAPSDVLAAYASALGDAGYAQQSLTTMPDGGFLLYDNGVWGIAASVGEDADGGAGIALTVAPSQGG